MYSGRKGGAAQGFARTQLFLILKWRATFATLKTGFQHAYSCDFAVSSPCYAEEPQVDIFQLT
jgi:hypothetical protein